MSNTDHYTNWPHRLPPYAYAARIVDEPRLSERKVMLAAVPEQWRYEIGVWCRTGMAARIVEMPERADRLAALDQVPDEWRGEVEERVKGLWNDKMRRLSQGGE